MNYANYIYACVHTLLVGKRQRVVHYADAQTRARHTTISPIQKDAMRLILPTKVLVPMPIVQFDIIFHGKRLLPTNSVSAHA